MKMVTRHRRSRQFGHRPTYGPAVARLAFLATFLTASCAPAGLSLTPAAGPDRVVEQLHAAPGAPAAPGPSAAAPAAASALNTSPANAPLRTEIPAGASDSALIVPALVRPNLPPREPWQPPDVPRTAFPSRIERWRPLVRQVIAEEWQAGTLEGLAQRVDDDLVLAMMQQESQGNPRALSYVGATGLMQVMPETFALMMAGNAKLAPAIDPDAFWDEGNNIRAGIRYLALALQNQEGNLYWSVASYNAGIGTVKRWRLAGLYAVPPYAGYTETAHYAQVILHNLLSHRPTLEFRIPDPMPDEHVPGALELLRDFRRR